MSILEDFQIPVGHPAINRWAAGVCTRLPATHTKVLLTVARFADEEGYTSMTQDRIAHHAGVKPYMVSRVLSSLEVFGLIRSGRRSALEGHPKGYQLMGDYAHWTIGLSKDELGRPISTLLVNMVHALREEQAVFERQCLDLEITLHVSQGLDQELASPSERVITRPSTSTGRRA